MNSNLDQYVRMTDDCFKQLSQDLEIPHKSHLAEEFEFQSVVASYVVGRHVIEIEVDQTQNCRLVYTRVSRVISNNNLCDIIEYESEDFPLRFFAYTTSIRAAMQIAQECHTALILQQWSDYCE